MEENLSINPYVIKLNRGGYIVKTKVGYIQFGSPPETIKDSMKLKRGVPQIFVLPNDFFNWVKGISVAEVEFPIYYNFFIKQRKTFIICSRLQFERFKIVLYEAVFGPRELCTEFDFDEHILSGEYLNLKNEVNYFSKNIYLEDMVNFLIFDEKVTFKGITVQLDKNKNFEIFENKILLARIPGNIEYKPTYDIGQRLPEPYQPPFFGITCLGPSHGFDPEENTSGFIIWVNKHGIMVDPPVNSTEWLTDSNVNPKLIDSIILTHCHADHDAGTFQKILEEGKINVYSTKTIIMSFLRKYAALTNTSTDYLIKLFNFRPIKIGKPEFINSVRFEMFYTLHSIPTIGFRMEYQGKSFVYSSDHNNDPEIHNKLLEKKLITKKRYDELKNFPWNSDVIYHESGIPPLHTPIKFLNSLPRDIQKKIVVYHISKKDFPIETDTDLTLAKFGIENTLYFEVEPPEYEKYYQILEVLNYLDFFDDMPIYKAQEFISIVNEVNYKKGEKIIEKGTQGDKFYIIKSGNVAVHTENLEQRKIYGACDYFGEIALITDKTRQADVVAETDVTLYIIEKDEFLHFIKDTDFENSLIKLAKNRGSETWNILSTSEFFKILTSSQKTMLESMFQIKNIKEKTKIIEEGKLYNAIYIIRDGEVKVYKADSEVAILKKGDFVGAMAVLYNNKPAEYTFINNGEVSLYLISRDYVLKFLKRYPGLIMKLVYDFNPGY